MEDYFFDKLATGKAVIHAGVDQIKSAGPLEGVMAGAKVGGAWGAAAGLVLGSANTIIGIVAPDHKDKFYKGIENQLFNVYDGAKNISKNWERNF